MGFIVKQIKFVLVVVIVILLFGIAYRMEPRLGLVNIEYEIITSGTMTYEGKSIPFEMKSEWNYKPEIAVDGKTTIIKLSDNTQISKNQFKTRELTLLIKDAKSLVEGTKLNIQNLICDISRAAANYREVVTTYKGEDKIEEKFEADQATGWIIIDDTEKMEGTYNLEFKDVAEDGTSKTMKLDGKIIVESRRTK